MVGIDMSDVIDLCDVDLSTCASLGMMQSFIDSPASDDDSNDGGGDAQDGESEGESEASVQIGKGGDEEDDDDSVIVVTAEELQANKRRAVEAEAPRPEKHGDCMGGDDDDEELVVVTEASKELRLPHARMHCTAHPLPQLNAQGTPMSLEGAAQHCDMCFCFVCDTEADKCETWSEHCLATDKGSRAPEWATQRRLARRRRNFAKKAAEEAQASGSNPSSSNPLRPPNPAAPVGSLQYFFSRSNAPPGLPPAQRAPAAPRGPAASTLLPELPRPVARPVLTDRNANQQLSHAKRAGSNTSGRVKEEQSDDSSTASSSTSTSSTSASASAPASSTAQAFTFRENGEGASGEGAAGEAGQVTVEVDGWVQCERKGCGKWRRGPVDVIKRIRGKWMCHKNDWDKARARCGAPEEAWEE